MKPGRDAFAFPISRLVFPVKCYRQATWQGLFFSHDALYYADCLLASLPMSDSKPKRTPKTQPSFSGGPPKPPKKTARGLEDQPLSPEERIARAKAVLEQARKGT
jgi:hypothetical protein